MQTEATERNAEMRDAELDEELAGILTAISVVSKRLAKKLLALQKQKELQLEQSAIFFENSNEGIVITNSNGNIVSINKAFSRITGYREDEVLGKNPSILNSVIQCFMV